MTAYLVSSPEELALLGGITPRRKVFTAHRGELGPLYRRIPPRSLNHNAMCECLQGTTLQEFHRPAFRRLRVDRLDELDGQFQGWIRRYNTHRRNHGDFMRGRTPRLCSALTDDHPPEVHLSPRLLAWNL